jgi:hypothetical protein
MKINFDEWFKFPIIVVNADWEELERQKKERSGEEITADFDYIVGECEVPHYDTLLNIHDVFRPSEKSFNKAKDARFDACLVVFDIAGTFTIPWNKEKFKREYLAFLDTIKEEKTELMQISLDEMPQDMIDFLKSKIKNNDTRNDSEGLQDILLGEENT